jgi:hypothetical protein
MSSQLFGVHYLPAHQTGDEKRARPRLGANSTVSLMPIVRIPTQHNMLDIARAADVRRHRNAKVMFLAKREK